MIDHIVEKAIVTTSPSIRAEQEPPKTLDEAVRRLIQQVGIPILEPKDFDPKRLEEMLDDPDIPPAHKERISYFLDEIESHLGRPMQIDYLLRADAKTGDDLVDRIAEPLVTEEGYSEKSESRYCGPLPIPDDSDGIPVYHLRMDLTPPPGKLPHAGVFSLLENQSPSPPNVSIPKQLPQA